MEPGTGRGQEAANSAGRASAKITGFPEDEVWPLVADYCNAHRWLPGVDTCYKVEGDPGRPGCVRYCGRKAADGQIEAWATEKLTVIDPATRTLSYEILENNVGLGAYESTIKVLPDSEGGCIIEWSFVTDPVASGGTDWLLSYIQLSVQTMAKRMEEALQPASA